MLWTLTAALAAPLVIGHRGAPAYLPDHTIEGYQLAIDQGADFIEPDLVLTSDGVLIARHENDLTHTTDAPTKFPDRKTDKVVDGQTLSGWFAEDFTLAEIKTLKAVQPYANRPHDHDGRYTIPTFDEVLDLAVAQSKATGRSIGVAPEMKHPSYFAALGQSVQAPLLRSLERVGWTQRDSPVVVQCFEPAALEALGAVSSVPRLLLIGELEAKPEGDPRTYGSLLKSLRQVRSMAHGIGVHKSALIGADGASDLVQKAHAAGLFVHVYTFRPEADKVGPAGTTMAEEVQAFYALGVDAVFADAPDIAVKARASHASSKLHEDP